MLCLCGWSYFSIHDELEIITFAFLGHEFSFYEFQPFTVLFRLIEDGPFVVFEESWRSCLAWMAFSALTWLSLQVIVSRIIRLFANPKNTLHGSARWATRRELKDAGLLSSVGLVMGQTFDAVFREKKKRKPSKKKNETKEEYRDRLQRFNKDEKDLKMVKPGDIITQNRNAHTLIVGSTRSGKGVSVIIPTEFRWPESMIIFDPKGEGWMIAANFRSRFSWCFKFEPEKPKESIHYNPLLSIRRGTNTIADIQNLTQTLIAVNENQKDPFWDNEARRLFAAVIGYVIYCEPPERKNFAQVYSVFSDYEQLEESQNASGDAAKQDDGLLEIKKYLKMYQAKIDDYMNNGKPDAKIYDEYVGVDGDIVELSSEISRLKAEGKSASGQEAKRKKLEKKKKELEEKMKNALNDTDIQNLKQIRKDIAYFANCEDKQLSSVLSTMTSHLQVIADPNVQAITDRSDFTMEDFVYGVRDEKGQNHPLTMFLVSSAASMTRLQPLFKLFYEQAITLLARELDEERPYRLLLMFDEFRQMGKMEIVEKALALTAGYGILCCVVIQTFSQLRELYGDDAIFIDNFAYQVVLRVSEPGTCEKIEKTLGNATKQHETMSVTGNIGEAVHRGENVSVGDYGRALMTADEIRRMPNDEFLLIASGMAPYKGKKIMYYQDERFRKFYLDKKGKILPPPDLAQNLPHFTKEKYIGIDREGWMLLRGADEAKKGSDDYIQSDKEANEKELDKERSEDGKDAGYLDDKPREEGEKSVEKKDEEKMKEKAESAQTYADAFFSTF